MPKWLGPRTFYGLFLFVMDVLALYVITGVVHYVRLGFWVRQAGVSLTLITIAIVFGLYLVNAYYLDRRQTAFRVFTNTFSGVAVSGLLVASVIYVTKSTIATTVFWRGNLPVALFFFALWASTVRYLLVVWLQRYSQGVRWLVIGEQDRLEMIRRDAERGPAGLELLFPPGGIESILGLALANPGVEVRFRDHSHRVQDIDGVVLATDRSLPDNLVTDLMHVRLAGMPVLESTSFYEHQYLRVPVLQLKDHWFALSEGFGLLHHESQMKIKRALDVTIAGMFLALASPLMLLTAVLVRLSSAGPALYSQLRCGQHGREFTLYKFRTMVRDAELDGARWAQPDDPRVTGLGRWFRRLRLDELPQLWNVLKGDMSFIGPRPERPDFVAVLEKEIPYYELRHLVKPGLTGWAQVMYGYGLSVEDAKNKLEYDLYYIKNYSLALDVYIMFRTARVVLSRLGV